MIDLAQLLKQIYQEANYRLRLDYSQQPVPALEEAEQKWAETLLQRAKIR